MFEELEDLREGGCVVIINEERNGEDFILIDSLQTLMAYVSGGGWDSIGEFEKEVGFTKEQIIGEAVCYAGSRLWFLKDEEWFNDLDLARMKAVFNRFVLKTNIYKLEYIQDLVVQYFSIICNKSVSNWLLDIFKHKDPTSGVTAYITKLAYLMLDHFDIVLTEKQSSKYFF